MTASRWQPLGKIANPFWELHFLMDRGQADLGDPAVPLFSLLPRQREVPQIEGARLRLTLSHRQSHGKVLATLAPDQVEWRPLPDDQGWHRAQVQAVARMMIPSGKGLVSGRLEWSIFFALHAEQPWVVWQSLLHNPNPYPVTLQRYAPLAVGPGSEALSRRSLADLFPARFRFFRLRSRPIEASAFYNLTERFGSLRLSEEPLPLKALALDEEALEAGQQWARRLVAFLEGLALGDDPLLMGLMGLAGGTSALLVTAPQVDQIEWLPQTDPLSPGLRVVYHPWLTLEPGATWAAPPLLLAWLHPQTVLPGVPWRQALQG